MREELGATTHAQIPIAEQLYQRTLALKEKLLGPDHPDIAVTANNLAVLYKTQRRYAEAERLYRRALTILERSLGVNHPKVMACRDNYAASIRASTPDAAFPRAADMPPGFSGR